MTDDLADLIAQLRERGQRITQPRREILRVLLQEQSHFTVEMLQQLLHQNHVEMDEATIYRTLQWLKKHEMVSQTDMGLGADVYCVVDSHASHHHLVCLNCKHVIQAEDSVFDELRDRLLHRYGFQPRIEHFAIFGLCKGCQEERKNNVTSG